MYCQTDNCILDSHSSLDVAVRLTHLENDECKQHKNICPKLKGKKAIQCCAKEAKG